MSSFYTLVFPTILLIHCFDSKPNYCQPTDTNCWPTSLEISSFSSKLNGELVQPTDNDYDSYIAMTQDLLYRNQYPGFIVVCQNVEDIQESVLFASSHHIQISIMSTGHSFSGRNTANNSLQIVVSKMRKYAINTNKETNKMESITVESGLQWGSIYALIAPNIIVGSADGSVGPVGYALGGGHSPISPQYGLSSDFTSEYFMVDANANIIHVYNTSGNNQTIDDLFWSLKGGGASTFGIIVNITFLIHLPEPQSVFTSLNCTYNYYTNPIAKTGWIADYIFNNLWQILQKELDDYWGGYLFTGDVDGSATNLNQNTLRLFFNFYGNSSYAISNAQPLLHLADPYKVGGCSDFRIYQTFQEYYFAIFPQFTNTGGTYVKAWNNLIAASNLTAEFSDTLTSFFNHTTFADGWGKVMEAQLQGGKVNSFSDDYTAVTPAFRHNKLEMGLAVAWIPASETESGVQHANEWEGEFRKFGIGIYSNEENYSCGSGCDWKQLFWGQSHYDRLLKVKQKWDPNQVFWCYHCVGSDQ